MEGFERFSDRFARVLYWIAGIAIILMMLLTCADVILRLFRRPIPGTYELVCFFGAVAVGFAMAHTSNERGHVSVSLIVRLLPNRLQAGIETLTNLLSLILFALISWRSVLYASSLRASGEVSLTLKLPFYPFVYGIGIAAGAVCLVLFVDLVKSSTRLFFK
ncbi:MAG: TRAP transporter small permease [Deltaproteobacteria bacterium]|nr:TRAP transporter small permease [Deltaproteobacteria bacterium]MBW2305119.1 TRAP transporter small permease [Deltaproteobacteria bacterium]